MAPREPSPPERVVTPEALRLAPVPPEPVAVHRGPTRLDRVERLVDVLAVLNAATPPGSPPILPVAALAPERPTAPTVREEPPANPARTPEVAGPWQGVGIALCRALIGTFVLIVAFLVARRVGLSVRLRVSLGSPPRRAGV